MPPSATKHLESQITQFLTQARDLSAKAEAEDRDFTGEERTQIKAWMDEAAKVKASLKVSQGDADLRQQITDLGDGIDLTGGSTGTRAAVRASTRVAQHNTIGRAFVESEGWKNYLNTIRPSGGVVSEKANVNFQAFTNALIVEGDPASGGAFLVPEQSGILVDLPMRERTLLDLVTRLQMSGESIQYVRVTALTNNAAGVAESTTTANPVVMNAAGGVKPESEMTFEPIIANAQVIAHWIPITTRMLSDAAALRGMIDTFLRDGVLEELERQVLLGTGTGEEIEGVDVAHTTDQPYSATVADLDPLLETTRKALTKIQLARRVRPTGFVFHPNDWEAIDLARMVKNPQNEAVGAGFRTLHGVPVVLSEVITEGFAYVGDWRQYVIWDRQQPSITVSNSHADFFIRNLLAILAEMRAAGGLLRTDAICKVDLTV